MRHVSALIGAASSSLPLRANLPPLALCDNPPTTPPFYKPTPNPTTPPCHPFPLPSSSRIGSFHTSLKCTAEIPKEDLEAWKQKRCLTDVSASCGLMKRRDSDVAVALPTRPTGLRSADWKKKVGERVKPRSDQC